MRWNSPEVWAVLVTGAIVGLAGTLRHRLRTARGDLSPRAGAYAFAGAVIDVLLTGLGIGLGLAAIVLLLAGAFVQLGI